MKTLRTLLIAVVALALVVPAAAVAGNYPPAGNPGKGKKKRPPRLDWWGHNPFEGRYPDIRQPALNNLLGLSDADTIHKLLKKAYLGKKKKGKKKGRRASASAVYISKKGKKKHRRSTPPIWFSEYTVLSTHPAHFFLGFYVSDQEQANWVTAAYRLVNSVPYVKGLGWYRLDDEPDAEGSAAWGLTTYTGQHKASFAAYQAAP
jgi:hypothetical protein